MAQTKAFQLLWAVIAIKRATFLSNFLNLNIAFSSQTVCNLKKCFKSITRPFFYFYSCLCAQLDKGKGSLGEAVIKYLIRICLMGFLELSLH